ncbi:MAG: hypothetical protein ACI4CT_09290 [Lachnospiraceae bacterium]
MIQEFSTIKATLESLSKERKISEYTQCTLVDMSKKVIESITRNHARIQKGVMKVMGGKVLEYEAKTILREGIAQGLSQGRMEICATLIKDGILSIEEASRRLGKTIEELEKYIAQ